MLDDIKTLLRAKRTIVIDTSSHNGAVDWHKVATDGFVGLAILKATEGATVSDIRFDEGRHKLDELGFPWQAYHFARADLGAKRGADLAAWAKADAAEEAEAFVRRLEGAPKPSRIRAVGGRTADVWLDWEKRNTGLPPMVGAMWVRAWVAIVEAAGYHVGFYGGVATWAHTVDSDDFAKRSDGTRRAWWVPAYGRDTGQIPVGVDPSKRTPEAYGPPVLWQYTSKGAALGVSTPVDLSVGTFEVVR